MGRRHEEAFAALVATILPFSSLTSTELKSLSDNPEDLPDRLLDAAARQNRYMADRAATSFKLLTTVPLDRVVLIACLREVLDPTIRRCEEREQANLLTGRIWCVQAKQPMVSPDQTRPVTERILLDVVWLNGRRAVTAIGHDLDLDPMWQPGASFALKVGPSLLLPLVNHATLRTALADFTTGRVIEAGPSDDAQVLVGLIELDGKGVLVTGVVDRGLGSIKSIRVYEYNPIVGKLSSESDVSASGFELYRLDHLHRRGEDVYAMGYSGRGSRSFQLYGPSSAG